MYTSSRLLSWMASDAHRRAALLLATGLLACPTLTLRAGEIYKSVDAQGHVVYSDRPDAAPGQQAPVEIQSGEPAADMEVRASESPPPLPDNEQPPCPDDGYLWTPGYWFWNAAGYYWIPGAWVQPPQGDVLWTPGYWEFVDPVYVFHRGYWARHVGYYGGINYGFGYFGVGFYGGYWNGGHFFYNGAYNHLGFHNGFVYNHAVAGFDGRPGGAAFAHGGTTLAA